MASLGECQSEEPEAKRKNYKKDKRIDPFF